MTHLSNLESAHIIARETYLALTRADRDDETARVCRWLSDHADAAYEIFADDGYARDFLTSLPDAASIFQLVHHALADNGEIAFIEVAYFGPMIYFGDLREERVQHELAARLHKRVPVRPEKFPDAGKLLRIFDSFEAFTEAFDARKAAEGKKRDRHDAFTKLDKATRARIEAAWSRESAMNQENWSEDNPAKDQCAVTAALIYELTGIPIVRGRAYLPDGRIDSHYWNRGVDLTLKQYPEGTTTREREGVQGAAAYEYLLTSPDLVRRLDILRARYQTS